jgi:methyl-accepting chemotaxis protein
MTAAAEALREDNRGIQDEISEALVALQFQDRVAQILGHVKTNIERMPACLAEAQSRCEAGGPVEPVSAQALLAELQGTYAMAEEHQVHQRRLAAPAAARSAPAAARSASAPAAPAAAEVTFF